MKDRIEKMNWNIELDLNRKKFSLSDRLLYWYEKKTEELIFALNPNIQGDTTIYYIQKKLPSSDIKVTTIARGISFGGELEYADEMTLARSLQNRVPVGSFI